MDKILQRLKPGSAVLDLGCGSGVPVDIEISKNHHITGVDISGNMIKLAQKNVPGGNSIHNDISKQREGETEVPYFWILALKK
ncbi:MAG: methyltransferase domain-containing protein [Spirochaetales bacterium]|nr:methyltransferase domain-containing protein [Spirochaetales bacterium]